MRVPTLILLVVSGVVLLACAAPEGRSSDVAAIQKESASPRLGSQSSPSASVAPAPRPKPALFVVNPEILVGLDEQRMVEILGWPRTIREEPTATGSEERRGGKEWVRQVRSRGAPSQEKQQTHEQTP